MHVLEAGFFILQQATLVAATKPFKEYVFW